MNHSQDEILCRIITLIRKDLHELEDILSSTRSLDPWALDANAQNIIDKRCRCQKLLQTLSTCLKNETDYEMKIATNMIKRTQSQGAENNKRLVERTKMSDDIMNLLRNKKLIEASELAEYLLRETNVDLTVSRMEDMEHKYSLTTVSGTKGISSMKKREPKAVRRLRKVYKVK